MVTRSDFDNALNDLRTAIEAAILRAGSGGGGPVVTDNDIATLLENVRKVNSIASGGGGGFPPPAGSLTFNTDSVVGGGVVTGTITLQAPATSNGETFNLSSDSSSATVQDKVTVGAGASSVDFAVSTIPVSASTPVSISAISPLHTFKGTFTVTP